MSEVGTPAGASLPFGSEFSPSQIDLRQLLELIDAHILSVVYLATDASVTGILSTSFCVIPAAGVLLLSVVDSGPPHDGV